MRYKIPTTLDTNNLDVTINLKTSDGTPLRHFNLGFLIYLIGSIFVTAKICNLSVVSGLPQGLRILMWLCLELPLVAWFVLTDKSDRKMGLYIPFLMDLYKKRKDGNLYDTFMPFAAKVDKHVMKLTTNEVCVLLDITGRASQTMSSADIGECVDGLDIFYRNVKRISDAARIETFTKIQPVKTTEQIAYAKDMEYPAACEKFMKHRIKMLERDTNGLLFNQYMYIIAPTVDDLSDIITAIPTNILGYTILDADEIPEIMTDVMLHTEL